MQIRKIEKKDNEVVEQIIINCLKETGVDLDTLGNISSSDIYEQYLSSDGNYWIVEEYSDVLGGCGVGPVEGHKGVCELQKMYLDPRAREAGIATKLLEVALNFAKVQYKSCYVESFHNMEAANNFYISQGFELLPNKLTEGTIKEIAFLKELKNDA